jgi:hypothetical protein
VSTRTLVVVYPRQRCIWRKRWVENDIWIILGHTRVRVIVSSRCVARLAIGWGRVAKFCRGSMSCMLPVYLPQAITVGSALSSQRQLCYEDLTKLVSPSEYCSCCVAIDSPWLLAGRIRNQVVASVWGSAVTYAAASQYFLGRNSCERFSAIPTPLNKLYGVTHSGVPDDGLVTTLLRHWVASSWGDFEPAVNALCVLRNRTCTCLKHNWAAS